MFVALLGLSEDTRPGIHDQLLRAYVWHFPELDGKQVDQLLTAIHRNLLQLEQNERARTKSLIIKQ